MSEIPIKDILFIRQYPTCLEATSRLGRWRRSCVDGRGASVRVAGHDVTFFFPGYGGRLRTPHPSIIEKLESGWITDIVDIGGGGALDPGLKRGDLVLSTGDVPRVGSPPMRVGKRKGIKTIVEALAKRNGRAFYESKILTSEKVISSRRKRIALFEKTGCSVVQMEHCRFLRLLEKALSPESFRKLHVTHVEIVADVIPSGNRFIHKFPEIVRGIDFCVLRNQHHIGKIKKKFLDLWLGRGELRRVGV